MSENTVSQESGTNLLQERLGQRISVDNRKLEFVDESQITRPRIAELLTIVKVTQNREIPKILIDSIASLKKNGLESDACKTINEWNEKLKSNSSHLSPEMYRSVLMGNFWETVKNGDYYFYRTNLQNTDIAIFGDPNVLRGKPQGDNIVQGLEKDLYQELGLKNLDDIDDLK